MLVGSDLRLNHVACPHGGADLTVEPSQAGSASICPECEGKFQAPLPTAQAVTGAYQAGHSDPMEVQAFASKKIAAGICGILLGGLGFNKFILEFNPAGIHYAGCFARRLLFGYVSGSSFDSHGRDPSQWTG